MRNFRTELLLLLIAIVTGCAKTTPVKIEPLAFEQCQAWNARQKLPQSTLEGRLEVSGEKMSGVWDAVVFTEPKDKIKIVLFDPFLGMETGRLESSRSGLVFVYGKTKFRIDIPPEILVQAILAKPDCSLVLNSGKKLRYELVFEENNLSSWTARKNLTIISKISYFDGFVDEGSSMKPRGVQFFLGTQGGLSGTFKLSH